MTLSLSPLTSHRLTYRQYRCEQQDPLNCEHSQRLARGATPKEPQESCSKCLFPSVLPASSKLRGNRGVYVVEEFLQARGLGRLYRGVQDLDDTPVIIREYVFPSRCFNSAEIYQRQQAFTGLAGLTLADGRMQDIRLITPYDAIADQSQSRCYLITLNEENAYPTLHTQLAHLGTMPASQVRRVLAQLLQSLELLHRQKFRLPNGQIQSGLLHGNLSLETLLCLPQSEWREEFVIYLSDLALWERLFVAPQLTFPEPTLAGDLQAIGQIGVKLLMEPSESDFPCSSAFENFLLRLLGTGQPFESLEAARRSLLSLPPEPSSTVKVVPAALEHHEHAPSIKVSKWMLLLALLLSVGGLILALSLLFRSKPIAQSGPLVDQIESVGNLPSGKFNYTAETKSLWTYVFRQKNLIQQGKPLEVILRERQPKLELNYQPEESLEAALGRVKSQQAEFLVTTLMEPMRAEFEAQDVAYDGLTVFVAFSYANRDKSLPRGLNGQISVQQLKRLYTGEIQNWRELGGADLPVRLYMPVEPELIRLFEQRVLKDEASIQKFRSLKHQAIAALPTFDNLRQVLRDFEKEQVGAISFGPLSQVFGQCLVYPLALVDANQAPVQPLRMKNGTPITPNLDLCSAKGSYDRNLPAFQTKQYPLMYSLAVVSVRNNARPPVGRKFAAMLQTIEGQKLLDKTGLIPLQKP